VEALRVNPTELLKTACRPVESVTVANTVPFQNPPVFLFAEPRIVVPELLALERAAFPPPPALV
jgi:hypothetical protein